MNRKKLLLVLLLIVVIVVVIVIVIRSRPATLALAGVVDADEVVVTPTVQARLDSLTIDEGSAVHAGDLLATLDRSELAAQAAATDASAAGARVQLAQATVSAEQVAGEAASAQASSRARLASARADVARQESQLSQLRNQATRSISLAKGGAISSADLERDTVAVRVQEQVTNASRESLRAAQADVQRADASALSASVARKEISSNQARLRGAQADSMVASTRLGYTELRAPASGIVQVLVARRGELVGPGSPVAVIVDPDKLWVKVAAPESDAGAVSVNDSLTIRLPSGFTTRGKVISKSVIADFATQHDVTANKRDIRAVAFRVTIPNPDHKIVPGMSAEVLLPAHPK